MSTIQHNIVNAEILPHGYTIYRKDRETRSGGGVLLAVKTNTFISSSELVNRIPDLEVTSVELITQSKRKLLICCCYRPPNAEHIWFDKFNTILSDLSSRHNNIIICGDFNLPKVNWQSLVDTTGTDEIAFTKQLNDFYLTQLNTLPTRGDDILDLVITSTMNHVENITKLNPADSGLFTDHAVIVFDLKTSCKAGARLNRTVLDFRRGDLNGLCAALQAFDFSTFIQADSDINLDWLYWKNSFLDHDTVKKFIPSKKIKGRNSPPWLNGEIIHAMRQKEAIRRKVKMSPTNALKAKFSELRAKVKKMVNSSRKNFFSSLDVDFQRNPKRFWSIFKLSSNEPNIPETMFMGKTTSPVSQPLTASIPSTITEIFNKYFTSVFANSNCHIPIPASQSPAPDLMLSDVHLTTEEVLQTLLTLDTNKATGPDEISPKLLKLCAYQIAPSLTNLFNKSLSYGKLPDDWKLANIVPVYKKGEKNQVENYRPISLLSVVSKVLERCVLNNIRCHLVALINESQHGFIPCKSCTSQLVEVLDYIGSLLDAGKQTDVIYMDMSKAFDKVSHEVLINKLYNHFGISGSLLGWFCSYLCNRKQRVTALGATSSEKPVMSGVPQG